MGPLALAPMFPQLIEAFDSNLTDVIQFTGIAILVLGFSNFIWYDISLLRTIDQRDCRNGCGSQDIYLYHKLAFEVATWRFVLIIFFLSCLALRRQKLYVMFVYIVCPLR